MRQGMVTCILVKGRGDSMEIGSYWKLSECGKKRQILVLVAPASCPPDLAGTSCPETELYQCFYRSGTTVMQTILH